MLRPAIPHPGATAQQPAKDLNSFKFMKGIEVEDLKKELDIWFLQSRIKRIVKSLF